MLVHSEMAKKPARVLVLGATGHAGQAVVRRALERGQEVTAATRQANPECLDGLGVRIVGIDSGYRALPELAAGHDLLVDAAAPYELDLGMPGSAEWLARIDAAIRRMNSVIEAARRHDLLLVYVGTYGTIPRQDEPPASDAVLWRRMASPYFEGKIAMEQAVMAAARQGLRAVVVNPVAFVGPWQFRQAWKAVSLGLGRLAPAIVNRIMSVIDVRDVAEAIDLAIEREWFGRVIPLAGHNVLLTDLIARTSLLAGVQPVPMLSVPGFAAAFGPYWAYLAFTALGITPPPYLGLIAITPELRPLEPSAEQIALGVRLRPLERSLQDAAAFDEGRPFAGSSVAVQRGAGM